MTVIIKCRIDFGEDVRTDWFDFLLELNSKEETVYNNAIKKQLPLNEVHGLKKALSSAYEDLEEQIIKLHIDNGDKYVMECTGQYVVDSNLIDQLVQARDPHSLRVFGLEELSDDELEDWSANDLDWLPNYSDFDEAFESSSPFDNDWSLIVKFFDPNEESPVKEG